MCGARLKVGLLLLALLLLLSPVIYSVEIHPIPGERIFQVPESELNELLAILDRQAETIGRLQGLLITQHETIGRLQNTLIRQQTTISGLETSFKEYESAVQSQRITRAARNVGLGLTIGVFIGIITSSLGG